MRCATLEEQRNIQKNINKISKSTRINFWDYTDFTSTDIRNNIIFLDIDGVLNGYNKWNILGWNIICKFKWFSLKGLYRKITDPCGVHESKVKRLAKIIRKTDAKVVMSSTWRFSYWENADYEDIQKLRRLLDKYDIEVIDITPNSSSGRRDEEINLWLAKHENEVNKFVILDDEDFDLQCFVGSNLVRTSSLIIRKSKPIKDYNTGLKNRHVKQAIEILTK